MHYQLTAPRDGSLLLLPPYTHKDTHALISPLLLLLPRMMRGNGITIGRRLAQVDDAMPCALLPQLLLVLLRRRAHPPPLLSSSPSSPPPRRPPSRRGSDDPNLFAHLPTLVSDPQESRKIVSFVCLFLSFFFEFSSEILCFSSCYAYLLFLFFSFSVLFFCRGSAGIGVGQCRLYRLTEFLRLGARQSSVVAISELRRAGVCFCASWPGGVDMALNGSSSVGVDPDDVQTQVDLLYEHILASVNTSLDNVPRESRGANGGKQRRVRPRSTPVVPAAAAAAVNTRRGMTAAGGVPAGAVGTEPPGPCVADALDVSTTTASTILLSDVGRTCDCSCHRPCDARDAGAEQLQRRSAHGAETSRERAGGLPLSLLPPQQRYTPVTAAITNTRRSSVSLRRRRPPSTFGSGRSGMCDPIIKTSAPGPGSYFCGDADDAARCRVAEHRGRGGKAIAEADGAPGDARDGHRSAEEAAKALRRQFTLLCQCYWKQFPELELPTNAAAHARNCPCQSIRTAPSERESRSSSSSSSSRSGAAVRVGASKARRRGPAVPSTSSPQLAVHPSPSRGAVFGTSPRRTLFAEETRRVAQARGADQERRGERGSAVRDMASARGGPAAAAAAAVAALVPGPGAYNVASAFDATSPRRSSRGVSIGRAERRLHTSTESPGPGAYDIAPKAQTEMHGKRNYFLTTSPRLLRLGANHDGEGGPGPAEYSTERATCTDARHKNAPAFSFGRAKLPGEAAAVCNTAAVTSADEAVPGPGTYDVPATLPDGGAVKVGRSAVIPTARRDANLWRGGNCPPDDVPGPGHYVLSAESTGPQWTFAARWSPAPVGEPAPGPGDYFIPIFDLRRQRAATASFATAPRFAPAEVAAAASLPGPGAYDTDGVADVARSAFMGTARRTLTLGAFADEVPGPGAYDLQHSAQERHTAIPLLASAAPRFDSHGGGDAGAPLPGPGYYDLGDHAATLKTRGGVIGTASRGLALDAAAAAAATDAGPGAYDVTLPAGGPSFSLRQRLTDPAMAAELTPGPGMYDARELAQGPSAVVGVAARFQSGDAEKLRGSVPGPGAYEAVLSAAASTAAVFGTSPRLLSNEEDAVGTRRMNGGLGPGVYDPQEVRSNVAGAAWGTSARFLQDAAREVPGPGAYEVAAPSPPRGFVFGTANDNSDWLLPVDAAERPGPGSYLPQASQERTASAAVFGSSPKNLLSPEERESFMRRHLGPGSYDATLQAPHAFHATFGAADPRQLEQVKVADKTPGPGHYSPAESRVPLPRDVVFGTAARMPPSEDAGRTPGPGAYAPALQPGEASPTGPVSFPTAPRFQDAAGADGNAATPGPGAYDADGAGGQARSGGAVVFGTDPRIPDHERRARALFPGPGQYQCSHEATTAQGPAYSFGKEPRLTVEAEEAGGGGAGVPGPGAYDVAIPTFTAPATRFGTAGRTMGPVSLAEVPGPGTYEVAAVAAPAYRFSTAPRELHVGVGDTPGPGQYDGTGAEENGRRRFMGPSFPTEPRFAAEREADVLLPGPGQYSPHHPQWDASQAYSFSSGKKEPFGGDTELPGPGTYNLALSPTGRAMRFGTAARGVEHAGQDGDLPGPGTYDVSMNTHDGPAFSLHRTAPRGPTLGEVEQTQVPGPGTYTLPPAFPATEGAGAVASFLKAERFAASGGGDGPQMVPGPGYYDPQLPQPTAGPSMGRAPRLAEVGGAAAGGADLLPGPGHYEVARGDPVLATTLDGGVAMRFTAARFPPSAEFAASEMPGPASYDPVAQQTATGAPSFPHAPRFLPAETRDGAEQPGPGEYSTPSAWPPSQGAGYSFGTSTRLECVNAAREVPGPGSYDTDRYATRYMTGPAFTLLGKPTYNEAQEGGENPGPGTYAPQPVEAARSATIGTAPRTTTEKAEDLPGPGAYLTGGPIVVPSQPAFSFGSASRPDIVPRTQDDVPGPGEYHHPIDPRPSRPVFTFAGAERFEEVEGSLRTPGPGEYYRPPPANPTRGPSFASPSTATAVAAEASAEAGGGPGPGAYFRPSHWDMTGRGPTFPITLGHFPPTLGADTPGPGAYHVAPQAPPPAAARTAQRRDSRPP
ncbi:uncharacterized protein Tco025E_04936 [Trypanosoma conorhini]|uniref:Uncharacterized protein n=1 Tax=Trypanosoma conorhini TaxID=83891 RepID=A0A3R7P4I3_9TRYP|nr:uncharacterized protein Tco025E_04936 [Trypanosoma conorhini]RNF17258.1 hypothetical protein Tco025E_04936 [Trypanosoma conorhini]